MSTEKDDSPNEAPLSPEQRLEILEGKVSKNRIVLLFVALILIATISAAVTTVVINLVGGTNSDAKSAPHLELLEGQAELLEQYDIRLAELNAQLKALENKVANNANSTIQRVLVEQEQAKQQFLVTVRSAIYDLAHMVPGSRSWLELYSEQLDDANTKSQQRENALKTLKSDSPTIDKDPFFGDDF